jgi:hypothetical protein
MRWDGMDDGHRKDDRPMIVSGEKVGATRAVV